MKIKSTYTKRGEAMLGMVLVMVLAISMVALFFPGLKKESTDTTSSVSAEVESVLDTQEGKVIHFIEE